MNVIDISFNFFFRSFRTGWNVDITRYVIYIQTSSRSLVRRDIICSKNHPVTIWRQVTIIDYGNCKISLYWGNRIPYGAFSISRCICSCKITIIGINYSRRKTTINRAGNTSFPPHCIRRIKITTRSRINTDISRNMHRASNYFNLTIMEHNITANQDRSTNTMFVFFHCPRTT